MTLIYSRKLGTVLIVANCKPTLITSVGAKWQMEFNVSKCKVMHVYIIGLTAVPFTLKGVI